MRLSKGLELSLAVTNLPLLLAALTAAVRTAGTKTEKGDLKILWVREFAAISASALLGAFAHGFDLPVLAHRIVWSVLFALLFALADGVLALALYFTGGYGVTARAVSVISASVLYGASLFLHWKGMYSVNMIPFCVYAFVIVAVSAARLARRWTRGAGGGKTALLTVLTAAAVLAVGLFDGKTFEVLGWEADGSVVSHFLLAPALLLLMSVAMDTLKKADGRKEHREQYLTGLQPSQFLISREKLEEVEKWFRADDLSGFDPIPVKMLDGVPVMTDGHTRAVAALLAGVERLPLVPEGDELDWEMYRRCVEECRRRGVNSPADLTERIVDGEEYAREWDGWCDRMQAEVRAERGEMTS